MANIHRVEYHSHMSLDRLGGGLPKQSPDAGVGIPEVRERVVTIPEILDLEEPIKNLMEKLRANIERGEYGLIIGDDASGRIPTLILGEVIKRISKLKSVRDPSIIFIPGTLSRVIGLDEQLQGYVQKYGAQEKDKVLIVTETVRSGDTLRVLVETLESLGHICDIATIGIEHGDMAYYKKRRSENLGNASIFSGDYYKKGNGTTDALNPNTPLIFRNKEMSGVYQNKNEFVSRTRQSIHKEPAFENSSEHLAKIQKVVSDSRTEAFVLVDKLVAWYVSQDKEKK